MVTVVSSQDPPWDETDQPTGADRAADNAAALAADGIDLDESPCPARMIGEDVRRFVEGGETAFADYAALSSGRDRFTGIKLPGLVELVGSDVTTALTLVNDVLTAKAIRWWLRGLPIEMARRKVMVDKEIGEHAIEKKREKFTWMAARDAKLKK